MVRNSENSGLYASDVTAIDGYAEGGGVYAGCNHLLQSWDCGISLTDNQGQLWATVPGLKFDGYSIQDLCLNKKTGTLLFAISPDFTDLPALGLGVKLKNEDTLFYITAEKDGIAADLVSRIYLDESTQTNDGLGAVYLLHDDTYTAHGKISKYDVQTKKWKVIESSEWNNAHHNSIRRFNGITYVCSYFGVFSYSSNEIDWTYATSLNVNSRVNYGFDPVNIPINLCSSKWYSLSFM
ncbi:MAG: hypothetical protein QM652_09210 [Legionella sp.]|uniref:hypothetical protein n=1 Tax=Legionella sp. TaxID=459 RepID=UPI0039E412A9